MTDTSVNLIRAFSGPRHARLERIWVAHHAINSDLYDLHVLANTDGRRCHADCLNDIWSRERRRPTRYAVLTEFDFLPLPHFLTPPDADTAVLASAYCTRDAATRRLAVHGYPGAWFVLVDKHRLPPEPGAPSDVVCGRLDFSASGPHNDPANGLFRGLGVGHRLLPVRDCYPAHYGIEVVGRGVHLFFSRHYNDPPHCRVAGFGVGDIQKKVDAAIDEYCPARLVHRSTRSDDPVPSPTQVAPADPRAVR